MYYAVIHARTVISSVRCDFSRGRAGAVYRVCDNFGECISTMECEQMFDEVTTVFMFAQFCVCRYFEGGKSLPNIPNLLGYNSILYLSGDPHKRLRNVLLPYVLARAVFCFASNGCNLVLTKCWSQIAIGSGKLLIEPFALTILLTPHN